MTVTRSAAATFLVLLGFAVLPAASLAQVPCSVFVSDLTGDDVTGDGSQGSPFQTIAAGIAEAVVSCGGDGEVRVGEGSYPEIVTLTEGIDLFGGYQCDLTTCTWDRDVDLHQAEIVDQLLAGVQAGSTVTRATRIDGFRIQGLSTSTSGVTTAAMTLDQGTPTVANNHIVGGDAVACSGCASAAIRVLGTPSDPAGALVADNTIESGDSPATAYGILLAGGGGAEPVASITGNVIVGGTARFSRAVSALLTGAGTLLEGNQLASGSATDSVGTAFGIGVYFGEVVVDGNRINADQPAVGSCTNATNWCGGLEVVAATATVTNNVIFGLPAPMSAGVFLTDEEAPFGTVVLNANSIDGGGEPALVGSNVSTAIACRTSFPPTSDGVVGRVRNNALLGGAGDLRFGFYEGDQAVGKTCRPEVHEFNAISAVDFFHRQWTSAGTEALLSTITQVNQLAYAQNNLDLDCQANASFHLPVGSPCIDAGTLTEAPLQDIDGDARPQGGGIDIGADEAAFVVPSLSPAALLVLSGMLSALAVRARRS